MRQRNHKLIQSVLVLSILTMSLTISGCSSIKKLDIFTTEVERQPLNLESPEPVKLDKIDWIVVSSENAEEMFARLKEQGYDPVVFGLSDEEYEDLAMNFAQIRAYIIKQNEILKKYREYYEPAVTKVRKELNNTSKGE